MQKSSDYWRIYYQEHKEERKAQQRAYYHKHKQARRTYSLSYYKENRSERLQYDKEYYQRNKQKRLLQNKEFLKHNPEKKKEYALAYQSRHREHCQKYWRNYQIKRRAIQNGLDATLTDEQWEAIIHAYKGKCAYCGIKAKLLTKDHVIPVLYGGGYTPMNIVPACKSCNSKKGSKTPHNLPSIRLLI